MVERNRFELGDEVAWESQARGFSKEKRGVVVRVLEPGERFTDADRATFPNLFRGFGVGVPRPHRSYVVKVGNVYYWPVVGKLRAVAGAVNT